MVVTLRYGCLLWWLHACSEPDPKPGECALPLANLERMRRCRAAEFGDSLSATTTGPGPSVGLLVTVGPPAAARSGQSGHQG